jgi:predicted AAA+ superfamily ATPase
VLADRPQNKTRFLVLGSASPDLISKSSESLAGRIAYYTLDGFSLDEVGMKNQNRLWLRGGYPRAYLASKNEESVTWRNNFIQTYLERDVPKLGIQIHSTTLKRFWTMLAHYHGQIWNTSEFARSFGVSDTTIRHYLHLLTSIFVIRQLPAWRENLTKRQVKAPKIYIADSGLFHTLLNISNLEELESHPKLGASWEGFIIQQLLLLLKVREGEYYFWATHAGAELDLLLIRGATRWGFEFKRTTSPTTTRSMHQAYQDLKLDRLDVIHAGDHTYRMAEGIRAVALRSLLKEVGW